MPLTALALLLTVLFGGFIAYAGDLIGRRMGKRRVTVLGLRPKHTAILITSATGTLISALTTAALFLVVPPVRNVIIEGEEALRRLPALRKENGRLTAANLQLEGRVTEKQAALSATEKELAVLRPQLARARLLLAKAEASRAQALRDVRSARAAEAAARATARQEQALGRILRGRNARLGKQNNELAEQNVSLTRDLASRSDQLDSVEKRLAEASARNQQLSAQNTKLEDRIAALEAQATDLEHANAVVKRVVDLTGQQLTTLNAQLAKARDENKLVTGVFGDLMGMYQAMRTRKIAYRVGEEVARRVIPAQATSAQVRADLQDLLQQASLAALARGAATGDHARAVEIVDKQFYSVSGGDTPPPPVTVSASDRIDALVSRLSWSADPVCVEAVAVANSVAGEPASIDIQPWPDYLIYRKGQTVGTRTIDNTASADRVFTEIVEFLHAVGRTALDRGMVPSIDPDTGEPQVGSLNAAEIARLVDEVRRVGGRVNVTAIASSDVTSADRLKLSFRVTQAQ